MYSNADITQWILGAFAVHSRNGNELNFPCPVCLHEAFYFNVKKQMGYCHHASCHATFSMERMINSVGYPPELAGFVPAMSQTTQAPVLLDLPNDAEPILRNHEDVDALYIRGVSWDMIQKFKIHRNKTHIIVPVYEEGTLVQYNSRRINRNAAMGNWFSDLGAGVKRYQYAKGHSITNYFLGWDECKLWDHIVMVENTFVSMWLRDLNCTTNFGSYLSATHIDKLVHSSIKHVTFLWDEGANSQKAQRGLKKVGIPSNIICIKGQPDDYSKETIKGKIKEI